MNNINEQLTQYWKLSNDLFDLANKQLKQYQLIRKEILGEKPEEYLSCSGIGDSEISYSGEEYWSYGGYEHHEFSLPITCLTDPEKWKNDVMQKAKKEAEDKEKLKKDQINFKEQSERQLLQKLKGKYES